MLCESCFLLSPFLVFPPVVPVHYGGFVLTVRLEPRNEITPTLRLNEVPFHSPANHSLQSYSQFELDLSGESIRNAYEDKEFPVISKSSGINKEKKMAENNMHRLQTCFLVMYRLGNMNVRQTQEKLPYLKRCVISIGIANAN